MKTNDIKRVIDAGLADVETTQRDVENIMDYIRESEERKPARGSLRGRVVKVLVAAVLLVLMLSVVAQALGFSVWDVFISWNDDMLNFEVWYSSAEREEAISKNDVFSDEERETWGEDVSKVLDSIDMYPALPRFKPEGFDQVDFYTDGDGGYSYFTAYYGDKNDRVFHIIAELYDVEWYTFSTGFESDGKDTRTLVLDGIEYLFASNLSRNSVSWIDEMGSYHISGDLDMDTLEAMIRSIERTPKND